MFQELKAKAADHWQTWLPHKWANLVATDMVDKALSTAARNAEKEIREWMDRGARLDEAEEIPGFLLRRDSLWMQRIR